MAAFISVPLKKSSEVDLVKPLSKYIAHTYAPGEERTQHLRAVEELDGLRISAVCRQLDKREGSLEVLYRYYDQLCAIEAKFPFSENQLCLTFTWKDAFDKGSLFSGSAKLALPSLGYEKTCVMFNIGALASQIATEQRLDSDEGLKTAAKFYQLAAGAFAHIKDTVLSSLNCEPTVDISPDSASALSQIMLAQAQEVFVLKATLDKMRDAIVAKLATQAADFYADASKHSQHKDGLMKYFYFQEVLPVLAAKQYVMQATAQYRQATVAKQQKKFGEEIARLQHATELLKTVTSRYDEYVNVRELSDKTARALTPAKKDNDFIYHERVPEVRDLERIGKAAMVKPTAIQVPLSQKFSDLFEKMVPMAVQQALAASNQRKAALVNQVVGTMRESTGLLNGILASLNLPAALEDLSGNSVPQSILEKSGAVIQRGGIQSIEKLIKDLPELVQRNREILDESLKMLDNEETTDNELRAKFGQRWQRLPSCDLYKSLRTEGAGFRGALDKAADADQVVRDRYNAHCEAIALLCKPEAELTAAIPSANPVHSLQGSEVVGVLRTQLAQLDQVKKERQQLENDIKSVHFDMTSKFLSALARDGTIDEEPLSVTELDNAYGSYTHKMQQGLKTQEEVLAKVQKSHQEFSALKQSNQQAQQREEVLKKLASAHDTYMEISSNVQEGTKFYNGLTEMLLKFQNKCSDIVFARKTERDEHLKDLQHSIAHESSAPALSSISTPQSTSSTPASTMPPAPTPAPRTMFAVTKAQPPARPPPPTFSKAPTTATPTSTESTPVPTVPTVPAPTSTSSATLPAASTTPAQVQGPPYPTYQGYPGFYPMSMSYNPYSFGQFTMPYMPFQGVGQLGFPSSAPLPQQQQQPQGYTQPQQPHYP
ncbi:programmed cell death 6-interacting protein-like [Brienomyrus brachyistius]|uniref:programmed cell death 6-interacting protein-like n=1 Tax=Brienomyrus brachyistius TaxID=42636 RepID=UPI0020B3108C|nr:programmed cell death 6-interacting protein-like [Brienomyrus brachyistius]